MRRLSSITSHSELGTRVADGYHSRARFRQGSSVGLSTKGRVSIVHSAVQRPCRSSNAVAPYNEQLWNVVKASEATTESHQSEVHSVAMLTYGASISEGAA